MDPPPTTVRDATELLDINMDQLARPGDLVALRCAATDRQAGGLIDALQLGHPVASQDPPHRGTRYVQEVADPVRPPPAVEPQPDDASLGARAEPVRAVVRSARAVRQAGSCPVPAHPPGHRRRGHLEAFSDTSLGPAVIDDQGHESAPALDGHRGVTVCHGRPPVSGACRYPPRYRGSSLTSSRVHNLPRNYS